MTTLPSSADFYDVTKNFEILTYSGKHRQSQLTLDGLTQQICNILVFNTFMD